MNAVFDHVMPLTLVGLDHWHSKEVVEAYNNWKCNKVGNQILLGDE